MSILQAELKLYKAAQNSDTAGSNGGVASYNEIVTSVNNNLLPDVSQAQRVAGVTQFRKAFFKNLNAAELVLLNTRIFVENYTPADDAVYFHAGNDTNLQSALTGSENLYGCGKLDANVSAAATTMTVLIEQPSPQFFRNGDVIRISDKATIDGAGNEEFVTVSGAPSPAGSVITLTFTPALANGYLATAARVSNCYAYGSLGATVDTIVATTVGSGDYDNITYPAEGRNVGTVYDTWTLTFTSATAYNCVGALTGSLAAGSTLSNYSPSNTNVSSPYFYLYGAGFTGAWQAGDTMTFTTHPAHAPIWVKRIVPAGATAFSGDKVVIAVDGETA